MLGHISLEGLFSTLWENKMRSVMVEGGASVISSFLKSGLVDSFLLTIAPVYVGKDGVSAVEDEEVKIFRARYTTGTCTVRKRCAVLISTMFSPFLCGAF